MKKKLRWLRIAVSLGILAVLFSKIPLEDVRHSLAGVRLPLMVLAYLLYLGGQSLSAFKWRLLAEPLGFRRRFRDYLSFYFIGMYFNLFLPTNIGGDVGRGYYLASEDRQWLLAYYSIVTERVTGTIALFLVASVGVLAAGARTLPDWVIWGTVLVAFGLFASIPFVPFLLRVVKSRVRRLSPYVREELTLYWRRPKILVQVFLLSVIFQLIWVVLQFLIGLSMGLSLPLSVFLVVAPLTSFAAFLPVSFNGIGLREAAYVFLLGRFGVEPHVALSFGILWLAVVVASSLVGGGVFLFRGHIGLKGAAGKA